MSILEYGFPIRNDILIDDGLPVILVDYREGGGSVPTTSRNRIPC